MEGERIMRLFFLDVNIILAFPYPAAQKLHLFSGLVPISFILHVVETIFQIATRGISFLYPSNHSRLYFPGKRWPLNSF